MKDRPYIWVIPVVLILLLAVFVPGWLLEAHKSAVIDEVRKGETPEFNVRLDDMMGKLRLIADGNAQKAGYGAVDNTVAVALRDILDQEMEELYTLGAFTKREYEIYKSIIKEAKKRGNAYFTASQYSGYGGMVGGMVDYYVLSVNFDRFTAYIDASSGKVLRLIWGENEIGLTFNLFTFFERETPERIEKMRDAWAKYYNADAFYIGKIAHQATDYCAIEDEVKSWLSDEWEEETVLRVIPIAEVQLRSGRTWVSIIGMQYHLKSGKAGFMWAPVNFRTESSLGGGGYASVQGQ